MAKPRFFSKNGIITPITPPKPRNRGAVVAVSLALRAAPPRLVQARPSVLPVTSPCPPTPAADPRAEGERPRIRGRDQIGQDVVRRLERRGLRVDWRDESFSTDWAAHSYEHVQQFFDDHPCTALFRALYEASGAGGARVLVAGAWVDMRTRPQPLP
jgi:hypothetical protein